jgi:hypothetical protein
VHTAVWTLHYTKHRGAAEGSNRPKLLLIASGQASFFLSSAITSLPILPWLLSSAVKMNLTAVTKPASPLYRSFHWVSQSSVSPNVWSQILVQPRQKVIMGSCLQK